jgi:hypothetical protein
LVRPSLPKKATIAVHDYLDDVHKLLYPPSRYGELVPLRELGKHVVIRREIGGYRVGVPIVVPSNIDPVNSAPGVTGVGGIDFDSCAYRDPRKVEE